MKILSSHLQIKSEMCVLSVDDCTHAARTGVAC